MSARNRIPQHALKAPPMGMPPMLDQPFARGPVPFPPHPALLDGPLPPHPAILEEKIAAQHQEIQGLLIENQRLAATHVALREELSAAQHEMQRLNQMAGNLHAEKDLQVRELYEKTLKLETELRAAEPMKAELMQLHAENQKTAVLRQELTAQVQALTQDLTRARTDVQKAAALRAEMDSLHQELQRARAAIEYEKKTHADQLEQSQVMEKNVISMAREVEKLRAELANMEKRGRTAVTPGATYGSGYGGSTDIAYPSGGYGDSYGMHSSGAEGGSQYGSSGAQWSAYDMQRAHSRR
eukprot:TRINITY_DN29678_c0_g1_i1.p1 TRINITY_DN29678_c0_g1~~TRINITY_DN29678_c0_g1_i1.p1  ORF type:complete len:298 (-),score=94.11 TRINITY_DN29678_c0_g1_i1:272-1165(-)